MKRHGLRYVDTLVDADDYWVTLLPTVPIRPGPVGVNKRSRFARASDLEPLSPIIDATAKISPEMATMSLTQISLMMAQSQTAIVEAVATVRAEMQVQQQVLMTHGGPADHHDDAARHRARGTGCPCRQIAARGRAPKTDPQ